MPSFQDHLEKVNRNLDFLQKVNKVDPENYSWQITVAYYVAVHLMQAHVAKAGNLHPDTHENLKKIIDPNGIFSSVKLNDSRDYANYCYLEMLSRKARYLCVPKSDRTNASHTVMKDLIKSIQILDRLITHISSIHQGVLIGQLRLGFQDISGFSQLNNFQLFTVQQEVTLEEEE